MHAKKGEKSEATSLFPCIQTYAIIEAEIGTYVQ